MSPEDEFITVEEVRALIGLHPNGMRRRLQAAGVAVYSDPLDRRRHLIKRADLPVLVEPLLVERGALRRNGGGG